MSAWGGHRSPPGCRGGVRPRFLNRLANRLANRLGTETLRRERIGKVHDHQSESSRVDNPGGGANLRSRCFQPQQDQPLQRNPRFHRVRGKEETAGRRYPGDQGGIFGEVWGGVRLRPRSRLGIRGGMPTVAEFFVPELMMLGLGNQRQRRRQDAGIGRPGDFHETAGKPGKSPLREFLARRRFLDPGGVNAAGSVLTGQDIGADSGLNGGLNWGSNGGKGLLHHGLSGRQGQQADLMRGFSESGVAIPRLSRGSGRIREVDGACRSRGFPAAAPSRPVPGEAASPWLLLQGAPPRSDRKRAFPAVRR